MKISNAEKAFTPSPDKKWSEAGDGMIATAFPAATRAGQEILKKGGNAIDAAAAAALALGVCEPQASGIGGQTMMLIGKGKRVIAIDGSSRAPSLAHVNAIYRDDRSRGYRASTVPSTLATLYYVHNRYGTLPWSKILAPAIDIAEGGYRITELQSRLLKREQENFMAVESLSGARYFLKDTRPYEEGEVFTQGDLCKTLKKISDAGPEIFYSGSIARQIDGDMRENGGLLRYDDLALVPWPIERKPLKARFRRLTCFSMPPPGAGRTLLFTLMMLNYISPRNLNRHIPGRSHIFVELFRKALLERNDRPFDPNFYAQISDLDILNQKYARSSVKNIISTEKMNLPVRETIDEQSGETTHLSVIDRDGVAVSLTQSIERVYGSKAAAAGLGFLYNNYLVDFDYQVPAHPFYLRPNAVPWATVAPSLIYRGSDIWMAVGSPGSERIFSAIAQFLVHIIDEEMPVSDAMTAPRIHCSLGGRISIEADRFPGEVTAHLQEKGYRIDHRDPFSFYMGAIHAVLKKSDGSGFQGVAEIRRDGTAGGISPLN